MSRRAAILAVPAVIILLAMSTSCSEDPDRSRPTPEASATTAEARPASAEMLEGTTYLSTNVVGRELVEGTQVQLSFEDGVMAVSAGCNTFFSAFEADEGLLRWAKTPASTLIGCTPDLESQDQWLAQWLTEGVEAAMGDGTLTLSSDDVTVELSPESGPDLDSLLGRTWTLISTIENGSTEAIPREVTRPSLSVRSNGLTRINTGCNVGRTTVRVDGDALVFGPATTTRKACPEPAGGVERTLLALINGTRIEYVELRDDVLVLRQGDRGLVFRLSQTAGD